MLDRISLLLVTLGALLLAGPRRFRRSRCERLHPHSACPHDPDAGPRQPGYAASFARMDLLSGSMERMDWPARNGGLYDALTRLHDENPFAALCAARGVLCMFTEESETLDRQEKDTVALLYEALDEAAGAGGDAADPAATDLLFSYAMRAVARLESAHG